MEKELITLAAKSGLWPLLFVVLLLYTIADSRNREKRYESREDMYQETIHDNQSIIKELTKKHELMERIDLNVRDIKTEISRR